MRRGFILGELPFIAIKNALAVKSERKELIYDIHNGIQGQAALRWVAVRCFAALGLAAGL